MAGYQDRVIAEKRELDAKHSKLAEFIGGNISHAGKSRPRIAYRTA